MASAAAAGLGVAFGLFGFRHRGVVASRHLGSHSHEPDKQTLEATHGSMNIREHVRANPRNFCCTGESECPRPQYPRNEERPELGCKGFRCGRCKGTVGWCKGAAHGEGHPGDNWCDDCFCEVYIDPSKKAEKALKTFGQTTVEEWDVDDPKPNVRIKTKRTGNAPYHWGDTRILQAVRAAGVTCPIYINGKLQE